MFTRLAMAVLLCIAAVTGVAGNDKVITILAPNSTSTIPLFELERRDRESDVVPGVSVAVEVFANHAQALARLLNGEVEFLFTGSSVGWGNHLNGGPMVMVGSGVWGVSSILGNDETFSGVEDLMGKKLVLPFPGAPLDLQMRYILIKAGIDPDADLQIVYAPFPQAAAQLIAGQVDAAPLPEPLATTLVKGRGLKRYVRLQDAWAEVTGGDPLSPQVSLFATSDLIESGEVPVSVLLESWASASDYVAKNPEISATAHAERLGQPVPIVVEALRNTIFFVPDPTENRIRVLEYFETVGKEGSSMAGDEFFPTD